MALPFIAAGLAAGARVVASKLATRAVGGITGAGAKSVGAVYKNQGFSEAVLKQPGYTPKNSLNTGSVKVTKPMGERNTKLFNEYKTDEAGFIKSGQLARDVRNLKDWENSVGNVKKPTIKINSNPGRGK